MPKAMIQVPDASDDLQCKLVGDLGRLGLCRELCLDGSGGEFSSNAEVRRCGWGVAGLCEHMDILQDGVLGTLPCPV